MSNCCYHCGRPIITGCEEQILNILKAQPDKLFTVKELAELIQTEEHNARDRLKKLVEKNLVQKITNCNKIGTRNNYKITPVEV